MTVKDDLHHLVDELDDDAARRALVLLQGLQLPPVAHEAPIDGEPETEEQRQTVQIIRRAEIRRAALLAEDAEIDAEYERAYREHPISEDERRVQDAFTRAGIRSQRRPVG